MPRIAPTIRCGPEERQSLERLAASRTESKPRVERARMILGCLDGKRVREIARQCHTRSNTVIKWRQRFVSQRLKGLRDALRPGAQRRYDESFRKRILAVLEQPPPAYDVTGAGDTVIAVLALACSSGAAMKDAAEIANRAAGQVVLKLGTAQITLNDLREALAGHENS